MTTEIILLSISTKVLDRAGVELATPGSAVKLTTDCATGLNYMHISSLFLFHLFTQLQKKPISYFLGNYRK